MSLAIADPAAASPSAASPGAADPTSPDARQAAIAARPGRRVAVEDLLPALVADGLLSTEDADEVGRYAGLSGGEQHALVALSRRKLRAPASGRTLDLDALCAWFAEKVGLPHARIDPLKVDLSRVADVM
ncbi:MAG: hypothetical protein ACLGHB_10365, partial [Gammaproteobacteria bacterium]